jgi:hypothetical protein
MANPSLESVTELSLVGTDFPPIDDVSRDGLNQLLHGKNAKSIRKYSGINSVIQDWQGVWTPGNRESGNENRKGKLHSSNRK